MERWQCTLESVGKMKGSRVLITGGTGFVGSHVVDQLLLTGANVITTTIIDEPKSYFSTKQLAKQASVVQMDVRNHEGILNLITRFNIDFILHLAAQPIVEVALTDPLYTLDTNIMGTVSVLEAARKAKTVKGIIVASSDKAYGKLKSGKYKESDRLQGTHPYEVSKSAADLICATYVQTYGLPIITTRFGNIYGEGDLNLSRIIPGILEAVIKKQTLMLRSDGTYIRDYLYVKDVARGYLQLLENFSKVRGEAFNFGSKETLTVNEVIKIAEKVLKKKIKTKILNTAVNEIPYQSLDFTKINESINWTPKHSLKKTLPTMYQWYRKIL